MTVLANEQVIDGKGWRSGAPVERRKLAQWFLKITDFAEELLEGLETLDQWPDKVRLMQENWIGKSRGLQFRFRLAEPVGGDRRGRGVHDPAGHDLRRELRRGRRRPSARPGGRRGGSEGRRSSSPNASAGGTSAAEIETAEKKGFDTGIEVVHPLDPEWRLPVYIANFVLMDYGTGAIFGVPGHDQRDFEFATQISVCRSGASSRRALTRPREPIGDEAETVAGRRGQLAASSTA